MKEKEKERGSKERQFLTLNYAQNPQTINTPIDRSI